MFWSFQAHWLLYFFTSDFQFLFLSISSFCMLPYGMSVCVIFKSIRKMFEYHIIWYGGRLKVTEEGMQKKRCK